MNEQEIAILARIEKKIDGISERLDRMTSLKPKMTWQELKRIEEHNEYELLRRG